ncbi:MAG TPA: ABC transporter ATP-binding protein [Candidatus Saccharimonadales bacterium]
MPSTDPALTVKNVTKTFKIPLDGSTGLKQKLINALKGRKGYRTFTPLNDVSFTVAKGEFFGIVGRNGSGKSTLLKTIAGIYAPQKGSATVHGTLVPFIELGVGFNPELTGRENVFLNGALLGFSRDEMSTMYDEIIEFAELGDFMEERLKNYSSGMQVRLAFSIAIRARSDILLLDEVLAVGDEAFQEKCLGVFEKYKAEKKTVILVTHDMSVVNRFCSRALFLKDGKIAKIGDPTEIADIYSTANRTNYSLEKMREDEKRKQAFAFDLTVEDAKRNETNRFVQGEEAHIRVAWPNHDGVGQAGVALHKRTGEYVFGPNTHQDMYDLKGAEQTTFRLKLNVGPGEYFLRAALFDEKNHRVIASIIDGPTIIVDRNERWPVADGVAYLPHAWDDTVVPYPKGIGDK